MSPESTQEISEILDRMEKDEKMDPHLRQYVTIFKDKGLTAKTPKKLKELLVEKCTEKLKEDLVRQAVAGHGKIKIDEATRRWVHPVEKKQEEKQA